MWSSLQGKIHATYQELVAVFGEPNCQTDGYKTDAEWELPMTSKQTVTIYNYKTGKNYLGDEGQAAEDITMWHIGGQSSLAVAYVHGMLGRDIPPETLCFRNLI